MNNEYKHLNFIEKFIAKYYPNQPGWLRSFTFVIFVFLLAYAVLRIIGGEFSTSGIIYRDEGKDKLSLGKNCELLFGGKFFATNSKGLFYIILPSYQYYKLIMTGNLKVDIQTSEGQPMPGVILKYSRLSGEFDSTKIQPSKGLSSQTRYHDPISNSFLGMMVSQAFAEDQSDQKKDRVFVETLQLKPSLGSIKEGNIEFKAKGDTIKLLTADPRGAPAGLMPLVSGDKLDLGIKYYFSIPSVRSETLQGKIIIDGSSGIFSSYSEDFQVSIKKDQPYGQSFKIYGNKGSEISLVLLSRYDVIFYLKEDIVNVYTNIESKLITQGYRVVQKQSPLGFQGETNSIFVGESVKYFVVQLLLKTLLDNHIIIKNILYHIPLTYGDVYDIQVAGTKKHPPAFSDDKLRRILEAKSEDEFKKALELN